ncbi:hypothetical protein OZD63_00335 [Wolbachia endosymbiont of Drosophila leontia]|uniref:hypothetical protein n=1 Tax=Wolbachia endosymbiont of Drosophila leontia TaxID=3002580 RepID=UPI0023AA1350|nr:hypothetical protein [Wolbachia endosymbiont of Drosophila leontia]MDE5066548.1 hypothetical protein [Wolbachia endosymbiont of Drosophila leontia]
MKHTSYIIASAFATFMLLASVALSESSYFDFLSSVEFLSSAFTVVTVLVVVLSYKIISNNKEIEARKNKFAQKGLELEKELILEQKAKETANNQVEELNNQLQQKNKEIIGTKQQLDDECKNISELTTEKEKLEVELKSQEEKIQKLSTLKNKELNDKDSEIRELKNQLGHLNDKMKVSEHNNPKIEMLKAERDNFKNQLDLLMEECRIMKQKIAEKDACPAKLDYNLNKIKCKGERSLSPSYVEQLQKKMLNQVEELLKKQKVIEEMNNQTKELMEKVNSLTQTNNTLSDEMTTCLSKNEELVTFINETLSNIEREKEDLELLYSSEREQKGFLALKTIENCLENFRELYSKTKDRTEKLSIPVQRKGELSNPLVSPACRSCIQGH